MRQSLDEVIDRYSVSIIPKGTYVPPNKTTSNYAAALTASLAKASSGDCGPAAPLLLGYSGMKTKAAAEGGGASAVPAAVTAPSTDIYKLMNEKKLFLLIEGPSEFMVKQAKVDLQHMFDEELIRSSGLSGGGGGRYSVV